MVHVLHIFGVPLSKPPLDNSCRHVLSLLFRAKFASGYGLSVLIDLLDPIKLLFAGLVSNPHPLDQDHSPYFLGMEVVYHQGLESFISGIIVTSSLRTNLFFKKASILRDFLSFQPL